MKGSFVSPNRIFQGTAANLWQNGGLKNEEPTQAEGAEILLNYMVR
jgi:hypothetical protein